MHEQGPTRESLFGTPRGAPERPLLEVALVFLAFYLSSYVFTGSSQPSLSQPRYYVAVLTENLPRAALILYLMAVTDGLGFFGVVRLGAKSTGRGVAVGLGAFAIILVPGLLFSAVGIENQFLTLAKSGPRGSPALVPLLVASALATGYCEELYFRSYLMRRLGQAGLPPMWAAVCSAVLFAGGHAYQGAVGLVSGGILGLFFAWRWNASKNIHEIAIGHGLFDVAVFAIVLYS